MSPSGRATADQAGLLTRLRDTVELLEAIAADRSVLSGVPDEERKRLLQAVASVYSPDRVERRRMSKVVARERKAARVRGDQGVLQETGIRTLRRKPVFHTPNVFPTRSVADGFVAHVEAIAADGKATVDAPTADVQPLGQLPPVAPDLTTRSRVESPGIVVRAGEIHDAVDDERCCLEPARDTGLEHPLHRKPSDVGRSDLRQGAVTLSTVVAGVLCPLVPVWPLLGQNPGDGDVDSARDNEEEQSVTRNSSFHGCNDLR